MQKNVLVVASELHMIHVIPILWEMNLRVACAPDCKTARNLLQGPDRYDLLIVTDQLTDGSWKDTLKDLIESKQSAEIIVCTRDGDERLWGDVLQYGGYDLIVEPSGPGEVHRIVQSALQHPHLRRLERSKYPTAA